MTITQSVFNETRCFYEKLPKLEVHIILYLKWIENSLYIRFQKLRTPALISSERLSPNIAILTDYQARSTVATEYISCHEYLLPATVYKSEILVLGDA